MYLREKRVKSGKAFYQEALTACSELGQQAEILLGKGWYSQSSKQAVFSGLW